MTRAGAIGAIARAALVAAALIAWPARAQEPDYKAALAKSQAVIGKPVRDYTLRDREHRAVRLSDYRGKPLLVNFVYTGCFQVCPTTVQFLQRAVREARTALGADAFRVVTIGFNQPFDDPEAMAAFARKNGLREPDWEFLSPAKDDVEALLADFGLTVTPSAKGFDHIEQVTVVDANGVVFRQIYGETFELPMLVGPLKELMGGASPAAATLDASLDNLWLKVKLFCTVYDPATGGYRVNYSLFIEIFAGASVLLAILWFVWREDRVRRRGGDWRHL